MTTDSLREVAKCSLGLVYNLVASPEIILQSSASPRAGQRPAAFTGGHQENQVLTGRNCGLASKPAALAMGFTKGVQLESNHTGIPSAAWKQRALD